LNLQQRISQASQRKIHVHKGKTETVSSRNHVPNVGDSPQRGYKRHRGFKGGDLSHVAPNLLNREFEIDEPNQSWVTDFTYIRTDEGWLYLTIVLDLFSRQVVGWSMTSNPKADLVIDALLMALWRRKPDGRVLIHSDQGVQYTCADWRAL
jgi:putative transposase